MQSLKLSGIAATALVILNGCSGEDLSLAPNEETLELSSDELDLEELHDTVLRLVRERAAQEQGTSLKAATPPVTYQDCPAQSSFDYGYLGDGDNLPSSGSFEHAWIAMCEEDGNNYIATLFDNVHDGLPSFSNKSGNIKAITYTLQQGNVEAANRPLNGGSGACGQVNISDFETLQAPFIGNYDTGTLADAVSFDVSDCRPINGVQVERHR